MNFQMNGGVVENQFCCKTVNKVPLKKHLYIPKKASPCSETWAYWTSSARNYRYNGPVSRFQVIFGIGRTVSEMSAGERNLFQCKIPYSETLNPFHTPTHGPISIKVVRCSFVQNIRKYYCGGRSFVLIWWRNQKITTDVSICSQVMRHKKPVSIFLISPTYQPETPATLTKHATPILRP